MEKKTFSSMILLTASIAALAGLLFGYDTGVISGAILFIKDQFQLSATAQESVVSAVLLGAIFGAAFSGGLADRYGRRNIIIVTAVMFAAGAVGAALSPTIGLIVLFRLIIGMAIGIASYTAPLYISEISPPEARGALVSLNQLMITIGIVVSYLVDYALAAGENAWRWMFGFGAVPAMILILGMIALSESPRWLLSRDREKDAREALKRILKNKDIEKEIAEIRKSLAKKTGSWREVALPWVRPALIVGIVMAFFQQATGINTIIYYAPTIFEFAGFESHKVAILATVGVGTVNVFMTLVAIWLIDRLGRKPLLYAGLIGMAISLSVVGWSFHTGATSDAMKILTVASIVGYVASFAISLGPIFWLIIAEIYPLEIRGRAMSMATLANWGFNMLVASTFLTLIDVLGKAAVFWLYAVVCVAGIIFTFMFVPETKGISLEKIESYLKSGKPFRLLGEKS